MTEPISPNTTVSHYRIVAKLGAGGIGEVWLAGGMRLHIAGRAVERSELRAAPNWRGCGNDQARQLKRGRGPQKFMAGSPEALTRRI